MFMMKLIVLVEFFFFFLLLVIMSSPLVVSDDSGFIYNGFKDASNLNLEGIAGITPNGLLMLTNDTKYQFGHAFYSHPLQFKKNSSSPESKIGNSSTTFSFSSHFVFAIMSPDDITGQGLAFVIGPQRGIPGALSNQYLGLFNDSNNGHPDNHVVAVELDTIYNVEFDSIQGDHVGIDINSLKSVKSASPGYFSNTGYKNLSLRGQPMQVWVDYDGVLKQLNVTLAPINESKPNDALLSLNQDLSPVILDSMYLGFSASTQTLLTFHYILGWSFKINGEAQMLNLSSLPELPMFDEELTQIQIVHKHSKVLIIGLVIVVPIFMLVLIIGLVFVIRKRKFAEIVEDWEVVYETHRFSYKHLYKATDGFSEDEVIGNGAFGKVYHGVLPTSNIEVAIKKVSHDSAQGMEQFIAEIVSIGKLRHRNLVRLLGYCRRKGELLLVYDFMPNGSLDKFIFRQSSLSSLGRLPSSSLLNWSKRFQIIKGVGSGLHYLHEGCKQVVVHRDIKAGNVLLDHEMNGSLGDFGLAILFDHGRDTAPTSSVVGTAGYLAPEMNRIGMASTRTDVYAFGAFLLEVACGKRPIELKTFAPPGEAQGLIYLVDWVLSCYRKGSILQISDPNLRSEYVEEEMALVLNLGLLCCHTDPSARPTMRQVMQYLNGDIALLQSDLLILEKSEMINQAFAGDKSVGGVYPFRADDMDTGSSSPVANDSVSSCTS